MTASTPPKNSGSKRKIAFGLLGLVAVVAAGVVYRQLSKPRLNVILVTLDTTRADRLGVYGYKNGQTEALDALANRGVVFEHAYAPSPVTLPSHATMLTGLYPPEHDLRVNGSGKLAKEIPFLPQILKENGYETAAFIAAAVLGSQYGLNRGFDVYNDGPPSQIHVKRHAHEPRRDGSEIVDLSLDWLKGRNQEKPFFCWLHLYDAHAPYDVRADLFGDRFQQSPYDAGVAWEVQQLDRVTSYLKQQKLEENTLIVIVGDHGEGLDEHQETEHGMLVYNTTLHVPFIFVGPDSCKAGTRVETPVSIVDLTPTVLELLGLPNAGRTSGRSLAEGLQGQAVEPKDCYAETETPWLLNRWSPLQTIISGKWKYIKTTRPELYDLENDPGELIDLLETSEERPRLEDLLAAMEDSFVTINSQSANLSEKDLANLRTLGYVDGGSSSKTVRETDQKQLVDVKDMLPQLAKFETAKHLGLEGRVEEAIPLLQSIAEETKQFPAAKLLLGDCLAQAGRLADAERLYREVLSEYPEFVRARLTLGRVLLGQQLPDQALAEFQEFVQANPESASAHAELAQVLAQLGKPNEALAEYQKTIHLQPTFVKAWIDLGQLYAAMGRPADAMASFTEATRFDPDNVAAHAGLMVLMSQAGQADRAIRHGEIAAKLAPDAFEIQLNLGMLLISRRQVTDGLSYLRRAQELRPEDPALKEQIRQIESAQGKP